MYDAAVSMATRSLRRRSLQELKAEAGDRVLLAGVGTGLDLPWLPQGPEYVGIDLTPAMLARAQRRALLLGRKCELVVGDVMALPHGDATFDRVIMHLILAVVPDPAGSLAEAARVLRPGGRILVLDKFLRRDQRAPVRRLLSPLAGRLATRTDVVFEDCLERVPGLEVVSDEPAIAGGWFRRIVLQRVIPDD